MAYEYHVIPAPAKGRKVPGAKTPDARYAAALVEVLNAQAAEGWDYVRAEVLPCAERQGLTGSRTVYVNVLVFRRPLDRVADLVAPAPTGDAEAAMRRLSAPGPGQDDL